MDSQMLLQAAQAVGAVGLLGTALGALLGVAARQLSAPEDNRTEALAALLPGSNCAQCGYAGCKQAAAAMVEGRAAPTACPPGGVTTAQRVAQTLGLQLDLADAQAAKARDYSPQSGRTNPFLHLALHLSIHEQVAIDQPSGIRAAMHALTVKTGSVHDASHVLAECLAETIWQAQRDGKPLDEAAYRNAVAGRVGKDAR